MTYRKCSESERRRCRFSETFSARPRVDPHRHARAESRLIAALSGEVEKKLRMVPGVADAHVTVVLPEDDPLRDVDAPAERATALGRLPLPREVGSRREASA